MDRYIWSEAQKNPDAELTYIQEKEYVSLAQEIASVKDTIVYVSIAKRFPFLFYDRINEYITEDEFDVLMHYIGNLDLMSGFDVVNIKKNIIEKDILNYKYGKEVRSIYKAFNREMKDSVLDCLFRYEMGSENSFISSVKAIIEKCVVYTSEKMIIVYMDEKENEVTDNAIEICRILFLPVGIEVKTHYEYHIGIIGNDATMRVGRIRVL